jgi:hypothetical protein
LNENIKLNIMEGKSLEEQKEFLEQLEEKSLYYKLKRWEKKVFKYLRNLFYKDNNIKEHIERMAEHEKQYEKDVQEENEDYEEKRKEIEEDKKKEIELIEKEKNKIIEKKENEYNKIINKLESIKNDREKIIEFFNNIETEFNNIS